MSEKKKLRVLVGCEESGVVRDSFIAHGHNAWSNDLLPPRNGGAHLQTCVMDAIKNYGPWDIIILHPDCTALSVSGNRWYGRGTEGYQKRLDAISWTMGLWELAKTHARIGVCLENPVGVLFHHLSGVLQYVQPYDFGHGETKKTGLMLHGLPKLLPTNKVPGRANRVWRMPPSKNRKRDRSETYQGIAKAMAEQWGDLCQNKMD